MATYASPLSTWFYQGAPAASGTLYVYLATTNTLTTIYSDDALTTPISNPITLDANGTAKCYVSSTNLLRLDAYTSSGTFIKSVDPVYPVATSTNNAIPPSFRNGLINSD